jgi:hypothetical protein
MKDLISDKLDLEDLNKNYFQVRDQHPHVKDLICQNCKRGPCIPQFIFPKTTWLLKVRWCEELAFTTYQSRKSTPGGSQRKGKGPPPKIILNPSLFDYRVLPNIMQFRCTAASQSMDLSHQEKTIWEKSMVSITKIQPLKNHTTEIVFSGNQENWYDGMSKDTPTFLRQIETRQFFDELKDLSSYSFNSVTFIRVSPSYSKTAYQDQNYSRGGLHLVTMEKSRSPSKRWLVGGPKAQIKGTYNPSDFSGLT